MTNVFISHSSLDDAVVRSSVVEPLEQHGFRVWYSRDAIHGAEEWEKRIRQALSSAEWFLVALSPRSVQSEWVRAEVDWALENRRGKLVPVLIDDCNPQDCNLRLRQIQHVDLRTSNPSGLIQLLRVWEAESTALSSEVANSVRSDEAANARPIQNRATPIESMDDDPDNEYAPFKKFELLQIRKKLLETLSDLKLSVADYTDATMPLPRRIEIRTLREKIDLVNRELAARG